MKRQFILSVSVLVLMAAYAAAEVPQKINYQGRLTDGQGDPVPDSTYQIVFTIYETANAVNGLWHSGPQDILVINGLFIYQLGSANALPNTIFADSSRWLGITISGNDEMTPRTQLITVPYAYHSLRSDSTDYVASSVIDHGGVGGLSDDDHTLYLPVTGLRMMTNDFNVGGHRITNMVAGVDPYDAVNCQQAVKDGDPAGGGLSGMYPYPFIAADAVTTTQIDDYSIMTIDLANSSVSTDKLVGLSVTTDKLASSSVTTNKIQDDAVTNAKIAMNAVTSLEIATGAVASDEIVNGAIEVVHLGASARTAAGIVDLSGSTSGTTPATLDQFTINTPAAGVLLITVSGQFYFDLDASSSSSVIGSGYLGLCDSPDNNGDCEDTWVARYYQDADNASDNSHTEQFTIQRTFPVGMAGSYTFYLNGRATTSGATLYLWGNTKASAVFVQSTLSITSPAASNIQNEQRQK